MTRYSDIEQLPLLPLSDIGDHLKSTVAIFTENAAYVGRLTWVLSGGRRKPTMGIRKSKILQRNGRELPGGNLAVWTFKEPAAGCKGFAVVAAPDGGGGR